MRTEGSTNLSREVKDRIFFEAIHFPKIDRQTLARTLKYELEQEGWRAPSYENLLRMISEARNSTPDLQDRPWSVSTLADYDIPPEALPVVMKAWAKALLEDAPLTIRHAKWIVRLYCVEGHRDGLNIDSLTVQALEYANREKAIKITGPYPDKPQDMWWLWLGDAILYLDMTGDDSLVRKCMKCMKSMKGQTTTDIEELEVKLKIEQEGGTS